MKTETSKAPGGSYITTSKISALRDLETKTRDLRSAARAVDEEWKNFLPVAQDVSALVDGLERIFAADELGGRFDEAISYLQEAAVGGDRIDIDDVLYWCDEALARIREAAEKKSVLSLANTPGWKEPETSL